MAYIHLNPLRAGIITDLKELAKYPYDGHSVLVGEQKRDESILGESDFVKEVLEGQKERYERRYWLKAQGYDIDRVVEEAAEVFTMEPAQVRKPGNQPQRVKARSLVCYWAVRELGMSGTSVSKLLGIGQPAVSRAVVRGEKLAQYMNLSLMC